MSNTDLTSTSLHPVAYRFFDVRYSARLTCPGMPSRTESVSGQGGRKYTVTFPGTAHLEQNCTISDSSSITGIHGVSSLWLGLGIGVFAGLLVGLSLAMLLLWRRDAGKDPGIA